MCRHIALFGLCLVVALLVTPASQARSRSIKTTCGAGVNYYDGYNALYTGGTIIPVGQSAGAFVMMYSETRYAGDIREYVGIQDQSGNSAYVGIRDTGSGPQLYYEQNGTFSGVKAASLNTNYYVHINHDTSGQWSMHIDGDDINWLVTEPTTATPLYRTKTSRPTSGPCNVFDNYEFGVVEPALSTMNLAQNGPYSVNKLNATDFEMHGF